MFVRRRLKFSSPVISSPVSTTKDHVSDPHLLTFRQFLEPDPLMTGFGSVLTVQLYNGKVWEGEGQVGGESRRGFIMLYIVRLVKYHSRSI